MSARSAIHAAATLGRRATLLPMGIALVAAHTHLHARRIQITIGHRRQKGE